MTTRYFLLTGLLLTLLVGACSDEGDSNPTGSGGGGTISDSVSFATTIQPILNSRCATSGCHGAGSSSGGLSLGSNPSRATVVAANGPNGAFVSPGNSAGSSFYLKVIPTVPNPPGGGRMPASGGFLTTDQQDAIKRWIDQGALDN